MLESDNPPQLTIRANEGQRVRITVTHPVSGISSMDVDGDTIAVLHTFVERGCTYLITMADDNG